MLLNNFSFQQGVLFWVLLLQMLPESWEPWRKLKFQPRIQTCNICKTHKIIGKFYKCSAPRRRNQGKASLWNALKMAFFTTLVMLFHGHKWPLGKMVDHDYDHELPMTLQKTLFGKSWLLLYCRDFHYFHYFLEFFHHFFIKMDPFKGILGAY